MQCINVRKQMHPMSSYPNPNPNSSNLDFTHTNNRFLIELGGKLRWSIFRNFFNVPFKKMVKFQSKFGSFSYFFWSEFGHFFETSSLPLRYQKVKLISKPNRQLNRISKSNKSRANTKSYVSNPLMVTGLI